MTWWIRLGAVLGVMLATTGAHAQIKDGDLRLFIDTDVFGFSRTTAERVGEAEIQTQLDAGPGGAGLSASLPGYVGLGVGYAITRHIVTSLHFSFATHQSLRERYFDREVQPTLIEPTYVAFMARPELEIPFNPKQRVVFALLTGFDLRRFSVSDADDFEAATLALGPLAGVTTHLFVTKEASFDISALTIVDFLFASGDDPWADAANHRTFAVNVTVGMSLWP